MPPVDLYARYELLPTSDTDKAAEELKKTQRRKHIKQILFRLLTCATVMFLVIQGIKYTARAISRTSFATRRPCHGAVRNLSSLPSHYTLPSGDKIPSVALGVWKATPGEVGQAVEIALKAGYRHIDGAWAYHNEEEVGKAIAQSGINRTDIWVTSKLWNDFHAPEDVEAGLDESLTKLNTEYLDLYLIHWPVAFKKGTSEVDEQLTADPYPTWKKLEELVDKGKVRNIGVSNFNIARIKNLTANPLKYKPAVNQVELNFWNPQPELLKWSKENNLLLEAYSPLGSSDQVKNTLSLPEVQTIAKELGITPAQVLISWHVKRGTVVLPKSVTPSRIEENLKVFTLPEELFNKLEDAATGHPPQRTLNPSEAWKLGYDIFDENLPF